MDQLPRDVLADVLALVPPRTLAVSRCVCREWPRDVVDADARCHLRTDLLPVSVAGIFMITTEPEPPEFFVRPSMEHKIAADLESYEKMDNDHYSLGSISDCCNGLILLDNHVVNPATRQWMRLPPYPTSPGEKSYYGYRYLVFDPTVSPHFELFVIKGPFDYEDGLSEWSPLEYMLVRVYSSGTQRWEERHFLREEEHTATAANKLDCESWHAGSWHAVYRQGALYVHCMLTSITRINVSTNKYQVINLPPDINLTIYDRFCLGKSVGGVHFAMVGQQELQVWFLDESGSKTEWVLKHVARHQFRHGQTDRPWTLQYDSYAYGDDDDDQEENSKEPTAAEKDSDWDSDADNAADIDDLERAEKYSFPYIEVLGFHPYRDIVFLVMWSDDVVAYYFNGSKIQHLGELLIRYRYHEIREGFIYTPTWTGELPGANYLVRKRNSYSIEDEDLLHSIED